jgi:NADH-ubiquinone oxidoreductase chain 5
LILGPLTILIASGSAFYEIDIKKIVALSTLSQLGVIITAIGSGMYILRFFHLLTHAFFKALLFIRAGNLIHASERYQDLRVIGGSSEVIPLSKSIVIATSMSLCGLPFISAFYSKEIIIERLLIVNSFLWAYALIVLGVLITVFYSMRFLIVAISWVNRQRSLFLKIDIDFFTNFSMVVLILPAFLGGRMTNYLLKIDSLFLVSPLLK